MDYPNYYGAVYSGGDMTITSSEESETVVNAKSEIGSEYQVFMAIPSAAIANAGGAITIEGENTEVNATAEGLVGGSEVNIGISGFVGSDYRIHPCSRRSGCNFAGAAKQDAAGFSCAAGYKFYGEICTLLLGRIYGSGIRFIGAD